LKFIGYELKLQVKEEESIIVGYCEYEKLQKLIDKFIEKFLLCPSCKDPELIMSLNSKKQLIVSCNACTYEGHLDNNHKVVAFIIKNPPTNKSGIKPTHGIQ